MGYRLYRSDYFEGGVAPWSGASQQPSDPTQSPLSPEASRHIDLKVLPGLKGSLKRPERPRLPSDAVA